jgi:hypothetical protein
LAILYYTGYPNPRISSASTAEQNACGQKLADSAFSSCHSLNGTLPLAGGMDLADDITIPLGSLISGKLTPGCPLARWSDEEILRATRNGVGQDGRWLVILSSVQAHNKSGEDLLAIIASQHNQPSQPIDLPILLDQPKHRISYV